MLQNQSFHTQLNYLICKRYSLNRTTHECTYWSLIRVFCPENMRIWTSFFCFSVVQIWHSEEVYSTKLTTCLLFFTELLVLNLFVWLYRQPNVQSAIGIIAFLYCNFCLGTMSITVKDTILVFIELFFFSVVDSMQSVELQSR